MVNICFVGAGMMANKVHYPSLADFDDVKIAAICDLDENKRKVTAEKYGVERTYDDFRRMIDAEAPDGV